MLCGKVCLCVMFMLHAPFKSSVEWARSWPFGTLIGAFCLTFRARSDAPISVANGRDRVASRPSMYGQSYSVVAFLAYYTRSPVLIAIVAIRHCHYAFLHFCIFLLICWSIRCCTKRLHRGRAHIDCEGLGTFRGAANVCTCAAAFMYTKS